MPHARHDECPARHLVDTRPGHPVRPAAHTESMSIQSVQDVIDEYAYPVPAQLIEVLEDPRSDGDARILHLMDRDDTRILHAVDNLGRLHRTDGPALVRVESTPRTRRGYASTTGGAPGRGGYASTAWWVDGRPIDDAPGTRRRVARLAHLAHLPDQEVAALTAHLPHGFDVLPDGTVFAPSSVAAMLTEEDLLIAWGYADYLDPLVSLALSL